MSACPSLRTSLRLLLLANLLVWLLAWALPGYGAVVSLTAPNGREATADYRPGRADLPAVMIVHGFLQTREFSTVAALGNTLADAGYTVLAPTLTLNVSRRKRSLPCEAVHSHTFQMDVDEVSAWTAWLQRKGHQRVVLIGHSHGALAIAAYLAQPDPVVKQALLLGLYDAEPEFGPGEQARLMQDLQARAARQDHSLVTIPYTFCRRYVGPPAALLSYVRITRQQVLDWLAASRVPVTVILGAQDDRVAPDWLTVLRRQRVEVEVVPGANHFFDGTSEFDLHDRVLGRLQRSAN
ncbi:MAG: alpha/beta fold hydrolase [Burkholderiales bacterium]